MIGNTRPSSSRSRSTKDIKNSLEFLPSDGKLSRESSTASLNSRPLSSTSRKTPVPVKQISLQAVKRKTEQNVFTAPQNPIEISSSERNSSKLKFKEAWHESAENPPYSVSNNDEEPVASDEEVSDNESNSSDDGKAPDELKMEFITCLMSKDYDNATKLCTMILMYEPENTDALEFQKLISEKVQLDAEESESDDSDDSDDNSDSNDESSDEESEGDNEKDANTNGTVEFNQKNALQTENL